MPIYEYQCRQCGHQFEKIISFAQSDKVTCGKCEAKAERRLSTFGVSASKADAMGGCGTSACGWNPAMARCEKSTHTHGPGCGH
jgi:putative FmdB family regulatory protein